MHIVLPEPLDLHTRRNQLLTAALYRLRVQTWFDYRVAWGAHPWLLVYAVIVLAVLVLGIVGTAMGNGVLAILFIPALAGAYAHHLMVMKRRHTD